MFNRPQLSWGVRRTQGMSFRLDFTRLCILAIVAACAGRALVPARAVIDPGSAVEPLPPCPDLDTVDASLRPGAPSTNASARDAGRLAVVLVPVPYARIVDLFARDTIVRARPDSLGHATLRFPSDPTPILRIRSLGYHTAFYRVRYRPGFTDTLVVHLVACV